MHTEGRPGEDGEGGHLQAKERPWKHKSADTFISDFYSLEMWENEFLWLEEPSLWYLVVTILKNWYINLLALPRYKLNNFENQRSIFIGYCCRISSTLLSFPGYLSVLWHRHGGSNAEEVQIIAQLPFIVFSVLNLLF